MTDSAGRLRVALAGAGIGAAHVRGYNAVSDRFDVAAMCDIDAVGRNALQTSTAFRES